MIDWSKFEPPLATVKQVQYMRKIGLDPFVGLTKKQASELISEHVESMEWECADAGYDDSWCAKF